MISNRKYRFFVINPCDPVSTFDVTYVTENIMTNIALIEAATTGISEGDYVYIEGCDTKLNGVKVVVEVTSTHVYVQVNGTLDIFTGGTISKVAKRYVDPLNFYNTKFIWEKQSDEIFFRKKLNGKLKFNNPDSTNNDFNYFIDYILANECCKVLFIIEKRCSDLGYDTLRTEQNWNIEWRGYLTHNMGKWNLSHCDVETGIEVDDNYTCLLDNKTEDVNVLDGTETHSVSIQQETGFEYAECCADQDAVLMGLYQDDSDCGLYYNPTGGPTNSTLLQNLDMGDCGKTIGVGVGAWGIKKLVVTIDPGNPGGHCVEGGTNFCITGTFCITYIREFIITFDLDGAPQEPNAAGGNTWINDSALTIAGLPATKWVRNPSTTYNENVFDFDCSHFHETPSVLTFDYSDSIPEPTITTYDTGRDFGDVCALLSTDKCGEIAGIRSDFFEINPPGDTPGYVAGVNYVTGDQNKLKYLSLIQMSDYVDPTADQPAFIGYITFEQMAALWRIAFNAYWFVDDEGYVRVEHISWFLRNATIDTTTNAGNNKLRNKGLKIFIYDREDIPIREEFKWQHQGSLDFVGFPIKYSSPCVNPKNIRTNNIEGFSTDTTFLTFLSDPEDREGFVLIARDPDNITQIDKEAGKVSTLTLNNAHLSWANLHYNYHRHDRWLLSGNMNQIDENFFSAKKTKRQVPIRFAGGCCSNINPMTDLVVSELGNGQVDKMQKDNRDELFTFELLF